MNGPGHQPGAVSFVIGALCSGRPLNWHDDAVSTDHEPDQPVHSQPVHSQPDTPAAATAAIGLLADVRDELSRVALPLSTPGVEQARLEVRNAIAQLEDYILPRYRSLDAPLLAVVGGSTGAGKSTLVNALAGHPVTRAGAIRPTTRQPILLHHPTDADWFEGDRVLPGLSRIRGTVSTDPVPAGDAGSAQGPVTSLVLVGDSAVPQGIALLDAPDVDSISDDNRRLAGQLLAAADLWVFVTTANRYADAVPWKLLLDAAARDILVAVVLDRVPAEAEAEVSADLRTLLRREGLGSAEMFIVPEAVLGQLGMLPPAFVEPLRAWLQDLAADAAGRARIARRTLNGTVNALAVRIGAVAQAQDGQEQAAAMLRAMTAAAYGQAETRVLEATKDGALLRGEVLARWQDFVGTGEFFRNLEQGIGRFRDRASAFFRGEPAPAVRVEAAIETGLQAVIVDEAANAAEEADQRWRADPAGRQLLGTDDLSGTAPDFAGTVAAEIRDWQGDLMEMIRTEGQGKRTQARWLSFGINGLAAALMIVVFSMTAGLSGLEVGVAGGAAVVGQKVLEAVFGEDAVRRLARKARDDLHERTRRLLQAEQRKFLERLPEAPAGPVLLAGRAEALARLAEAA
jgi:energy-coupling factor transporter ATP-binding protein EcfA2